MKAWKAGGSFKPMMT